MNELIFVLDDENDICEVLRINFQKAGFRVKTFNSAESFFSALGRESPELIILDLMLPDMDGMEICRVLKGSHKFKSIPIIMLTARVGETEKVLGLELGADDYVTKPFSVKELLARVKAVMRRVYGEKEQVLSALSGRLQVYPEKFEAYLDGVRLELTTTEFRILRILVEKKGNVLTREAILDYLWGNEKIVVDRTIDVHIRRIREKLGNAGSLIQSVRGIGYKVDG